MAQEEPEVQAADQAAAGGPETRDISIEIPQHAVAAAVVRRAAEGKLVPLFTADGIPVMVPEDKVDDLVYTGALFRAPYDIDGTYQQLKLILENLAGAIDNYHQTVQEAGVIDRDEAAADNVCRRLAEDFSATFGRYQQGIHATYPISEDPPVEIEENGVRMLVDPTQVDPENRKLVTPADNGSLDHPVMGEEGTRASTPQGRLPEGFSATTMPRLQPVVLQRDQPAATEATPAGEAEAEAEPAVPDEPEAPAAPDEGSTNSNRGK